MHNICIKYMISVKKIDFFLYCETLYLILQSTCLCRMTTYLRI